MNYQVFDYNCYDYQLWELKGVGLFRGPDPRPLKNDDYICCIGAAATFGRFSNLSYPEILTTLSNVKTINFGVSAAGPQYFLEKQKIIDIANKSKVIVLEVLSARSSSTEQYSSIGGKNIFVDKVTGNKVHERDIYPPLFENGEFDAAEKLISEARETWVKEMTQLISMFTKPCILLWNSKRTPDFKQNKKAYGGYVGKYPQMVNQEMLDRLSPLVSEVVYSIDIDDPITVFESKLFGASEECRVGHTLRKEWGYYPSKYLLYKTAKNIALRMEPENQLNEYPSLDALETDSGNDFLSNEWRSDRFQNIIKGLCSELSLDFTSLANVKDLTEFDLKDSEIIVLDHYNAKCETEFDDYILCVFVPSLSIAVYAKRSAKASFKERVKLTLANKFLPYYALDDKVSSDILVLNECFTCDPFSIQAV